MIGVVVVFVGSALILSILLGIGTATLKSDPRQYVVQSIRVQAPDSDEWKELSRDEIEKLDVTFKVKKVK